jgi:hypothetical protein
VAWNWPDTPTINDIFTPVPGTSYQWNGYAWIGVPTTAAGAGVPEAPIDNITYGRQNAAWNPVLPLTGGTLSGPIEVLANTPSVGLDKNAPGQFSWVYWQTNRLTRFALGTDDTNESGANNGTDFVVHRYSDAGNYLGRPIFVDRRTGTVDFEVSPTIAGQPITGFPEAPDDDTLYGRQGPTGGGTNTWERAVAVAGDTMAGDLVIQKADPSFSLKTFGPGQSGAIDFESANLMRWRIRKNPAAESGTNAGSDFEIVRYADGGALLSMPLSISRATGVVNFPVPPTIAGTPIAAFPDAPSDTFAHGRSGPVGGPNVWERVVAVDGDTMTGNLTLQSAAPALLLNKAGVLENRIVAQRAGAARWIMRLADQTPETGNNAGSDFHLSAYNDAGTFLAEAFNIKRSTGVVDFPLPPTIAGQPIGVGGNYVEIAGDTMTGDLAISKDDPVFTLDAHAQQEANRIRGSQNGVMRWEMNIGDTWPETGGNTGSDFEIQRFDDAGTQIDTVFRAKRDTGIVDFAFPPTVAGQPIVGAGNFLPLPGGTMTGPIVLEPLAPQSDQDAVPKHYVDALVQQPPIVTWEPVTGLTFNVGASGGIQNYNWRTRFELATYQNDGGNRVRVTLRGNGVQYVAYIGYGSDAGLTDPYDFEGPPTQLLFANGATVGVFPSGQMSDLTCEADFFVDPTKDLLISVGQAPNSGPATGVPNVPAVNGQHRGYFLSNGNPAQVDVSGYSSQGQSYCVALIEQFGSSTPGPPLYLPIVGGTMTGPIILPTVPPVAADEAVGRQWVLDQIAAALATYQLYQGTWQVAANTPDIGADPNKVNGASWRAATADPAVPETCPPGMPPISGRPIANGDLVVWSQAQQTWGLFHNAGMTQAEADAKYLQLAGGTLTGELTFSGDGTGVTFNGGGRLYKRAGAGMVLRESSGGQQPQIENNDGSAARNVVDTLGATFTGDVVLPVNNSTPNQRAASTKYIEDYYMKLSGGTFSGGVTFNSFADVRGGNLYLSGPTNGNGVTRALTFRDGGNNVLGEIKANRTGYNVSPEARLEFYTNNGGWGWKMPLRTHLSSPAGIYVDGDVSAASFTDR